MEEYIGLELKIKPFLFLLLVCNLGIFWIYEAMNGWGFLC